MTSPTPGSDPTPEEVGRSLDATDRLELAILGRMHEFDFIFTKDKLEEIANELGFDQPVDLEPEDVEQHIDREVVRSIAAYLVECEELDESDDEEYVRQIVQHAMFIYGYLQEMNAVS